MCELCSNVASTWLVIHKCWFPFWKVLRLCSHTADDQVEAIWNLPSNFGSTVEQQYEPGLLTSLLKPFVLLCEHSPIIPTASVCFRNSVRQHIWKYLAHSRYSVFFSSASCFDDWVTVFTLLNLIYFFTSSQFIKYLAHLPLMH